MNKTIVMEKGEGRKLVDRFETQINQIVKELQHSGYFPVVVNIFQEPCHLRKGIFILQVFCYLGHGKGKRFEYSLQPGRESELIASCMC